MPAMLRGVATMEAIGISVAIFMLAVKALAEAETERGAEETGCVSVAWRIGVAWRITTIVAVVAPRIAIVAIRRSRIVGGGSVCHASAEGETDARQCREKPDQTFWAGHQDATAPVIAAAATRPRTNQNTACVL